MLSGLDDAEPWGCDDRPQASSRLSVGRAGRSALDADGPRASRHDGDHRVRLFLSRVGRRRKQARGLSSGAGRQHRVIVRLHAAICRVATAVERVSRPRLDDCRRSLQRFRRTGAGRRRRDRANRAAPIWRYLSDGGKGCREGSGCASFYKWPAHARPKDVPRWNFHKYPIGRDRYIVEVFPETVDPLDTRIKTAVARLLADS